LNSIFGTPGANWYWMNPGGQITGTEAGDGLGTISVLVVEDNPTDLKLIRRMLKSEHAARHDVRFDIKPTSRLSDAVEQVASGVDIVLLDLGLPDSQGLITLQRLRERNRQVPVVILSGLSDRQVSVEALHSGAQDYLVKDLVDGRLLTRAILRHVRRESQK
jgi:DNA-binding response OmpR family regulator